MWIITVGCNMQITLHISTPKHQACPCLLQGLLPIHKKKGTEITDVREVTMTGECGQQNSVITGKFLAINWWTDREWQIITNRRNQLIIMEKRIFKKRCHLSWLDTRQWYSENSNPEPSMSWKIVDAINLCEAFLNSHINSELQEYISASLLHSAMLWVQDNGCFQRLSFQP